MKRLEIVDGVIFLQGVLTLIYLFGYDRFPVLEENTPFLIIGLVIIGLGMYFMTYLKENVNGNELPQQESSQQQQQRQEPQRQQIQQEPKHPHPLPQLKQEPEPEPQKKDNLPRVLQPEELKEQPKDVFKKFNEIKGGQNGKGKGN